MVRDGKKIVAYIVLWCIQGTKIFFNMPRGCCKFTPSCSDYAREALEKLPMTAAITAIIKRTAKCHPLHVGGFDPVPDSRVTTKG